ncbi:hypothetical protein J1N35_028279 [Gossypium stocksii]|uniref:Uncharacterized protein n=1 Tax=Gossypium stocksii TaxID=47602 RepID=A0A9D3ZSC9_9ROSI|nr:hypothetical protein J1N35_028279 [Gossypium stocksii]
MAESVASGAVESVTNQALTYASSYLRYFFYYGKIVQDFTNQRNALKLRKQRVDTRIDEAKRQIEIIYDDVEDWLRSAEKELKETQNLKDEIDRVGYRRPLQGIFITSTDFMDSESLKSAFNEIMEAINAKGVKMIGLHGFQELVKQL